MLRMHSCCLEHDMSPTRPSIRMENGAFGFGHDYYVARGKDEEGNLVKGFGKTKEEAEADFRDKLYDD